MTENPIVTISRAVQFHRPASAYRLRNRIVEGGGGGKPGEDDDGENFDDGPGSGKDGGKPDPDDDDDDGEDDEPKPFMKDDGTPFTAADYEALQAVVAKARKEAREAKKRTPSTRETDDKGKPETDPVKLVERARVEAEETTAAKWKPLVVRGQAASALKEAGLIGPADRLLKLLDYDDIDVDPDTGELDGLDEQVADLKRDYAHLFRRKGSRSIDAADRSGRNNGRKLSDSEIQARQLQGADW